MMHLYEVTFYVVSIVAGGDYVIALASESENREIIRADATLMLVKELTERNIPYNRYDLTNVDWLDEDVHQGMDSSGHVHTWRLVYEGTVTE